jgi:hypothetical protein
MNMLWHYDRNDVPDGDGPLLARDMSAHRDKMYARARNAAHVLRIIENTRDPALYEHAGDAPCTAYFVVERKTDDKTRATVLRENLAWIVRFLAHAGETVDPASLLVLSGSQRGKASYYHVIVPSLYLADEDARQGMSMALRAYNGLDASDVDPEPYGKCAMLRTIGSSEFGAGRPLRPSALRPDEDIPAAEYLINPVRAGARSLRFGTSVATPAAVVAVWPTQREAVVMTPAAVADTQYEAIVATPAAVVDTQCEAVVATPAAVADTQGEVVDPDDGPDMPATLSIRQTIVLLGKMQELADRLIESPGGVWDTIENLGDIARALCTAASKHPTALAIAKEMLDELVAASTMNEQQTQHAARCFQHAQTAQTLDPLMTLRGFVAETPEGKLRAWVEGKYTHVPLREKDAGTKLAVLFGAYTSAVPPVHTPPLGKTNFASMLRSIYANVGPHKNTANTATGIYLLR